jgi:serine/threonine protein kinase
LRDQADRRLHNEHHLYLTSQALGLLPEEASLASTLDVLVGNLLEAVAFVHSHSIVHRDIKPSNCLISSQWKRLVLIDFGSAADLSTAGVLRGNVGLSNNRVAVSPIYAAPEVFVEASRCEEALKFDCFSVGLLISQLLFQYLEERTESGFRQQLEQAQWDLDVWLQRTLQSKVRPIGVGDALQVLQDRPGFWRLLQDLLREDPYERITAQAALERWKRIAANQQQGEPQFFDGTYLQDVFDSMENCEIPSVRSLRFVATFQRSRSLGLYLAEAGSEDVDLEPSEMIQWKHATADAIDGEVFVQGTVAGGQAEEMEIFEVGDRLNGIGELPFKGEGFEKALAMVRSNLAPRRVTRV